MWPSTCNTKTLPIKKSIAARATLSGFGTDLNYNPNSLETTKFIVTLKPVRKQQDVNDSKSQTTSKGLCQCDGRRGKSEDKLSVKNADNQKEKTILNTFRLLANSKFITVDDNKSSDATILVPPTNQMKQNTENTAQTRNNESTNHVYENRRSSSRKLEIKEHMNFITRTPIRVSSDKCNQANLCSDGNLENLKKMIIDRIRKSQELKIIDDLRKKESKFQSIKESKKQESEQNEDQQQSERQNQSQNQAQNQQPKEQQQPEISNEIQCPKSTQPNTRHIHDPIQRQKTNLNSTVNQNQKLNQNQKPKNPPNPKDYLTKAQNMQRNNKQVRSQSESPHPQPGARRWSKESTGKNLSSNYNMSVNSYTIPKTLTSSSLNQNKSLNVEPRRDRRFNKNPQQKQAVGQLRAKSQDRNALNDMKPNLKPLIANQNVLQNVSQAEKNQSQHENPNQSQNHNLTQNQNQNSAPNHNQVTIQANQNQISTQNQNQNLICAKQQCQSQNLKQDQHKIFSQNQSQILHHNQNLNQNKNLNKTSNQIQNQQQNLSQNKKQYHYQNQIHYQNKNLNQTLNLSSIFKPILSQNLNPILKPILSQNPNQNHNQNLNQKPNLNLNFKQNQARTQNTLAVRSDNQETTPKLLPSVSSFGTSKPIQKPFPYLTRKNIYPNQNRILTDVPIGTLNLNLNQKCLSVQGRTSIPSGIMRLNLNTPTESAKQIRETQQQINIKSQVPASTLVQTKNPQLTIAEDLQHQSQAIGLQDNVNYDIPPIDVNAFEQDTMNAITYDALEGEDNGGAGDGDGDNYIDDVVDGSAFNIENDDNRNQNKDVGNHDDNENIEEDDDNDDDDDDDDEDHRLTGGADNKRSKSPRFNSFDDFGSFYSTHDHLPPPNTTMARTRRECLRNVYKNCPQPPPDRDGTNRAEPPKKDDKKAKGNEKDKGKGKEKEKDKAKDKEIDKNKKDKKDPKKDKKEDPKKQDQAQGKKVSITDKNCCERGCAYRRRISQHQAFLNKHGGGPACDRIALLENQLEQLRYDLGGIRGDATPNGVDNERFELLDRRLMELNFLITDMKISCGTNRTDLPPGSRYTLQSGRSSIGGKSLVSQRTLDQPLYQSQERYRTAYLPGPSSLRNRGGGTRSTDEDVHGAHKRERSHSRSHSHSHEPEPEDALEEEEEELEEEEEVEPPPHKCEACNCHSDIDTATKLANCIFIRTKKCTCDHCNCRDLNDEKRNACMMLPETLPPEENFRLMEEVEQFEQLEEVEEMEDLHKEDVETEDNDGICRCNHDRKQSCDDCETTSLEDEGNHDTYDDYRGGSSAYSRKHSSQASHDSRKTSQDSRKASHDSRKTSQGSHQTDYELGKDTSFCRYCNNSNYPVIDNNDLCVEVMRRLGQHCINEIALTILLQPNGLYHINIALIATGEHIACLYATELAIRCANQTNFFADIMTFFIVDSRNSNSQKNQILKHTFEFVDEER